VVITAETVAIIIRLKKREDLIRIGTAFDELVFLISPLPFRSTGFQHNAARSVETDDAFGGDAMSVR